MANVKVKGPFWSADVEVIKLAEPQKNWAFRNLFLDNTPRRGLGQDKVYLPGTLLLLCRIRQVQISPTPQQSYYWNRESQEKLPTELTVDAIRQLLTKGQLSLLLVQANSEAWPADCPCRDDQAFFPNELICLAGEIHLDALKQQNNNAKTELFKALNLEQVANGLQGREGAARLLSEVSVHSSGLSIFGKTKLPWQEEKISAPFQVAKLLPDLAPNNRQFRLTLEKERLTETEQITWRKAWQQLSIYLNPKNPLNSSSEISVNTPNWVTLEITNPLDIPRLYWQIPIWKQTPELHFAPDDFSLLLSDQQPYDQQNPPTSLARFVLGDIAVKRQENSDPSQASLEIVVKAGSEGITTGQRLNYIYEKIAEQWHESFTFSDLKVAFNPIEVPQFLRKNQNLSVPEWLGEDEPIQPAVLWGFMPLENGWAQLPVPNLTEQIYLDSGLAKFTEVDNQTEIPKSLIQGAVSLGNDRPEVLKEHSNEQPWNVTLTNAQRLQEGRWILKKVTDSEGKVKFQVTRVTLSILDPEVTLNGIFWLSTGKPTPEDALPDLQNWISGVRSLPLKTIKPELDLFPNPAIVTLEKLEFSLRPQPTQPASTELPSALLKAWNFAYEADEVIFGKMVERKILPADTFSQYFPLIWQRHATLPMVQALPLTQTQSPPNYPSASRQLVPFELGTANSQDGKFAVPKDWFFGVSGESGAASWPVLMSKAQPAREWKSLFDLPLVSLSIPGVVLDPKANAATTGLTPDEATQLPVQYRFDLPYTDEINALAQLPKIPRNPDEVSPLPDSPPPEPPKPLTRETFAEHWQHLSELASLSSVDATAAFVKQGEQTVIQHLIEPFDWSVEPTFDLGPYPGSLNLQNGVAIALSKETALRGISGKFVETDNGQITGTVQADNPYIIEAGSMAAHADGNGGFRDQRGLVRSATIATTKLIKTPITFHKDKGESEAYELISALDTVNLQIGEQHSWKIWFRDLPVQVETGSFTRQSTVSEQAEDINDPEAFSREHNFLTGYEWRLAEAEDKPDDFVSIFNLRFYPLTLEQVSIQGEQIEKLTIIGRLQLPLTSGGELKEFSNAVRLTFEPNPTLKLTAVELEARPAPDAALPGTFKIEIDERSQTWVLSWTGPMTPAEETALQTLPGDPDFKLGINKLIKQVRQQKSPNPTAKFTQAISYISPGSEMGEWPLALQSDEASDAPRLLWKKISLNSDQNRIDVENIQLNFFLFGVEWSIKLDESEEETAGKIVWSTESKKLSFSQTESDKLIEGTYTFPELATLEPLSSEDLKLVIDVASNEFNHKASLLLSVELGRERVTDGLQVLYTFAEGDGTTVKDVSGVGEPLNLIIENPAAKTWLPGGGLAINAPTIVKSAGAAKKLTQACKATNEITIEAWIKPASTATPKAGIPARIVTLAQDGPNGNISLQQGLWDNKQASDFYGVRLRTTTTGNNGEPLLVTPPGTLKTDLTHVVYTRDAAGVARLYINGVKQANTTIGGDFSNWDANYRLALADELSRERYWLGEYHLVAIYSCALSAAEVRQNYQAGSKITSIQERSAFEAKVRFLLAGANTQQNTNVLWESASLFRDMEIGVNARSILFTENALQFQWQSYTPKYSNLQLLPGMHVNSSEAPGFAALTFETDSEQGDIPKLRLKTAFIEALVSCQWGTFLQTNPISSDQTQQLSDVQAQVYASSAGDVVFGYTAQWQEQKASWNESLLLNGFLEIKNLISWPKEMSIKPEGNLTKLTLPSALTTTGQPQALKHIRHTIRILLNQHLIPAEVLVVGKGELLFQLAKNQSWQFLAVVEHQLIDILPGTQLTLENDRRWTTVQEVRLTLPETFKRFLSAQSNISTTDPVEGINALENANSGYLAAKLRAQLAGGDTPELDKLSADTLLVEASAPHWVRKEAIAPASATTLQFLPNGSQLGILSNPQDYAPSDPQAPEWLLLTMPFLGRLQDKNTDGLELLSGQPPTNTTTLSSLQIDPIICLTTKPLSDLSLALNFSSWGNNATVEIAISNFDTAVGRTWSRLDPLSLEENWFRLQNPLTAPQPTGLQSV
ncbi:MAG TPA: hypothetical protein DCP31_25395, partial [Cyanobacteria bacterium UBA8543]|nr:hypothetical protein [Cyanobacteria bacterium UBA8543]